MDALYVWGFLLLLAASMAGGSQAAISRIVSDRGGAPTAGTAERVAATTPFVMSWMLGVAIFCWVSWAITINDRTQPLFWSWWGFASGVIYAAGSTLQVAAVAVSSVAVATIGYVCLSTLTSFAWGAFGPAIISGLVVSWPITVLALFLILLTVVRSPEAHEPETGPPDSSRHSARLPPTTDAFLVLARRRSQPVNRRSQEIAGWLATVYEREYRRVEAVKVQAETPRPLAAAVDDAEQKKPVEPDSRSHTTALGWGLAMASGVCYGSCASAKAHAAHE